MAKTGPETFEPICDGPLDNIGVIPIIPGRTELSERHKRNVKIAENDLKCNRDKFLNKE